MHRWCYRYTYCSHTFCFHQYHSVHYAQHALMMNPVSAKKMVMLLQEAYPARPKVDEQNKNRLRLRIFWVCTCNECYRECIFSTSLLQCRPSTTWCRSWPYPFISWWPKWPHDCWLEICQMQCWPKWTSFFSELPERKNEKEKQDPHKGKHPYHTYIEMFLNRIPHRLVIDLYILVLIQSWQGWLQ